MPEKRYQPSRGDEDGEVIYHDTSRKMLGGLMSNVPAIAIILTFVAGMGATWGQVTALSKQFTDMTSQLAISMEKVNTSINGLPLQADKIRSLEINFDRLQQQVNQNYDRQAAALQKAIDDGRARNNAQDNVMNEQAANYRVDHALLDRINQDLKAISDSVNGRLPRPNRP